MPTSILENSFRAMENCITTTATIIAPYSDIFEATLPNGKKTLAHFSRSTLHLQAQIAPGVRVKVELTPFDFDVARIVAIVEEEN
jgi:translation initiation factor IF-1